MDERMPTRVLARLSPPPGGEQRLRAALRGRSARGVGWGLPLAGAGACVCVLAIILALRPDPMDAEIRHAVSEAVAPPPGGVRMTGANVESIESPDPAVRIYRLAGTPAARSPGG